jgi:hypothetical protein
VERKRSAGSSVGAVGSGGDLAGRVRRGRGHGEVEATTGTGELACVLPRCGPLAGATRPHHRASGRDGPRGLSY